MATIEIASHVIQSKEKVTNQSVSSNLFKDFSIWTWNSTGVSPDCYLAPWQFKNSHANICRHANCSHCSHVRTSFKCTVEHITSPCTQLLCLSDAHVIRSWKAETFHQKTNHCKTQVTDLMKPPINKTALLLWQKGPFGQFSPQHIITPIPTNYFCIISN